MKIDPRFAALPVTTEPAPAKKTEGGDFAARLAEAIDATDQQTMAADAKADLAAKGDASLHDVALALEKADIEMRLLMRGRNKIVDAYQEIMRMPV